MPVQAGCRNEILFRYISQRKKRTDLIVKPVAFLRLSPSSHRLSSLQGFPPQFRVLPQQG